MIRIAHLQYLDELIVDEEKGPETVVYENGTLFRQVVCELNRQKENMGGGFTVCDEKYNEINIYESVTLLSDILRPDLNDRKFKARLLKLLNEDAEIREEIFPIIGKMNELGNSICMKSNLDLSCNLMLTNEDILKILDFKIDLTGYDELETIIIYIKTCQELMNHKAVITVNLKDYLDVPDFTELIKEVCNLKIPFLMIERHTHDKLDDPEHLRIVDQDLCVI